MYTSLEKEKIYYDYDRFVRYSIKKFSIFNFEIDDIVQEAWMYIFSHIDAYNPEIAAMTTWMFHQVHSAVRDWKERHQEDHGIYYEVKGGKGFYDYIYVSQVSDIYNDDQDDTDGWATTKWFYDGEYVDERDDNDVFHTGDDREHWMMRDFVNKKRAYKKNTKRKIIAEGKMYLNQLRNSPN